MWKRAAFSMVVVYEQFKDVIYLDSQKVLKSASYSVQPTTSKISWDFIIYFWLMMNASLDPNGLQTNLLKDVFAHPVFSKNQRENKKRQYCWPIKQKVWLQSSKPGGILL